MVFEHMTRQEQELVWQACREQQCDVQRATSPEGPAFRLVPGDLYLHPQIAMISRAGDTLIIGYLLRWQGRVTMKGSTTHWYPSITDAVHAALERYAHEDVIRRLTGE